MRLSCRKRAPLRHDPSFCASSLSGCLICGFLLYGRLSSLQALSSTLAHYTVWRLVASLQVNHWEGCRLSRCEGNCHPILLRVHQLISG